MNELIKAIATVIASKYNFITYINKIGEGFERPSFFIYRISDKQDDLNRATYKDNVIIQIIYFSAWDNYENASAEDQNNVIDTIKKEFANRMIIKTGNLGNIITAKINSMNVDYTGDDDIFLQLDLDIVQARDITDIAGNTETYELMQNIVIKEGGN